MTKVSLGINIRITGIIIMMTMVMIRHHHQGDDNVGIILMRLMMNPMVMMLLYSATMIATIMPSEIEIAVLTIFSNH